MINVTHDMKIMDEETLGPILPVMTYSVIDEAIGFANRTQYGLGGAVFAGTEDEAMEIARKMKCGAISINDAALTAVLQAGEKYPYKMSGIGGTRIGPSSIKKFMKQKAYIINGHSVNDPWWFG